MSTKLWRLIKESDRRLVIPLMGYPGIRLTKTTIKQNEFNWGIQFWSLTELVDLISPDGIFFLMDLSIEAGALGFPVRYPIYEIPSVEFPLIKKPEDLEQFMAIDILKDGRISVFLNTMKLMSANYKVLCGGYCIGPFTLSGLLMGTTQCILNMIDNPSFLHEVLNFSTRTIIHYASALVDNGADIVMILEPTVSLLSPAQFEEFSAKYIRNIAKSLCTNTVFHVCGNAKHLITKMLLTEVDGLSLDDNVDFTEIFEIVEKKGMFLMGNINPVNVLRNSSPEEVKKTTESFLNQTRNIKNLVLSTGCDVPYDAPIENIKVMVETGKNWKL